MYIVVDADEMDVTVYSSNDNIDTVPIRERPVPLVNDMVTSIINMTKLFRSSEFVLLHLEDKLQEFFLKANTLKELKNQLNLVNEQEMLINLME